MTAPSTLVRTNPDGSEQRICGCGDHYELPIPYAQANPAIRDLCPVCLSEAQYRKMEEREA